MSDRILAIVGPTCSGKSSLAFEFAKSHGCAFLSADAMQVYRGMDIGTGKAYDVRGDVHFHGIDLIDANETYSAAQYQLYGRNVIMREIADGGSIVVCGGTGFYVRALLDDMEFAPGEQLGNPVRDAYLELLDAEGPEAVWEALKAVDPESAAVIHPNNAKRVVRALEMAAAGESYAERAADFAHIKPCFDVLYVALSLPREALYARIEQRVDTMMASGLVDEVSRLCASGLLASSTARQAIGYKEIVEYLEGNCTLETAVVRIKQATRRYAKRQISWFKRDPRIHWIDGSLDLPEQCAQVEILWQEHLAKSD